jgi:hypothetical protein
MPESLLGKMPPIAGDSRPEYRLVVGATKHGARSYVWAIVRDDDRASGPVRQSPEPYRSMEDAHAAGVIALRNFRAQRAQ